MHSGSHHCLSFAAAFIAVAIASASVSALSSSSSSVPSATVTTINVEAGYRSVHVAQADVRRVLAATRRRGEPHRVEVVLHPGLHHTGMHASTPLLMSHQHVHPAPPYHIDTSCACADLSFNVGGACNVRTSLNSFISMHDFETGAERARVCAS
jgi:hypothetical protein